MRQEEQRKLQEALQRESSERERREVAEVQAAELEKLLHLKEGWWKMNLPEHVPSRMKSYGWQYEVDGWWHSLPAEATDQIQEAYLAYLEEPEKNSRHTVNFAAGVRRLDFNKMLMWETSCSPHSAQVRRIRIWAGVPEQWVTTPTALLQQGDHLESLYVEVTDSKMKNQIESILRLSGQAWGIKSTKSRACSCMRTAKVISVYRVENWRLWQQYKVRRATLRREHAAYEVSLSPAELDLNDCGYLEIMKQKQQIFDCGEALASDVDEKILLYGTSWVNAASMIVKGFEQRHVRRGIYGDGIYFASAACKSHQYTCPNHWHQDACSCQGRRTLIFARVALGDAYKATEPMHSAQRPPDRSNALGFHDSIVVFPGSIKGYQRSTQIHQEFVVFDPDQAYPCFVVHYELWSHSTWGVEDFLSCVCCENRRGRKSCVFFVWSSSQNVKFRDDQSHRKQKHAKTCRKT